MSFSGYLIQIGGNSTFFNKFIVAQSYKVAKKVLDLDSYRDANGLLHRNALDHLSYTIEFDVKPLNDTRMQEFLSAITSAFSPAIERKVEITFYLPEEGIYKTSHFYMVDPELTIDHIENNMIHYSTTTVKFIGY